jgi:type I restriction enzyme R subunit
MINYVYTVADKMSENTKMMKQIQNNTREQAMLGEFDSALDDAVLIAILHILNNRHS